MMPSLLCHGPCVRGRSHKFHQFQRVLRLKNQPPPRTFGFTPGTRKPVRKLILMKRDSDAIDIDTRSTKRGRVEHEKKAKRIVIHAPGGYDQLAIEEVDLPVPQAGEVLVEVVAIGVNYADVCVRLGVYESAKKVCELTVNLTAFKYVGWPICPGFEFSGRVVAFGAKKDSDTTAIPVEETSRDPTKAKFEVNFSFLLFLNNRLVLRCLV